MIPTIILLFIWVATAELRIWLYGWDIRDLKAEVNELRRISKTLDGGK